MKKVLNFKKENLKICLTVISVLLMLMGFGFYYYQNNSVNQAKELERKRAEKIAEILQKEINSSLIEQTEIQNTIIQMVFQTKDQERKTYLIRMQDGEEVGLKELIKEEHMENFKKKVRELINLKYPKFIADVLNYGNGTVSYQLKENELILYFYQFIINPKLEEEINLHVNYNEIKDYISVPVKLDDEYEVENGYHYQKDKKTIALTFDDGPNGKRTRKLLELLSQNKMHATFFMVGNRMAASPDLVKEVLQSENEIGSHSYNHKNLSRLQVEELKKDAENINHIYESITGQNLHLLRPPYGSVNNRMKENLNYAFVNWNLDTEDWRYRDSNHVYNAVLNKVGDGDIILMHDLYDSTVEAVEKLLPELYVRGFQVVSVTELATLKGKTLELHNTYHSFK
ncbi:MAG: polysaccharide deacetylase family protein [Bacilli bacterium]|nr:polysaccharide deacetylase family protein [Bacilli bacterium]